ncbi:hypothetical protein A8C56_14700 [Niabella ginsenosidivorans]|uniref:Lipoprotein n=1 Tax=Niabella ginsenosidivorans TaxID=1176587 RepID=A0A1A9I3E5_9BACT|nr:hypothetical protein [Niabella ginsenosidivorans]ANH82053.1 hypothetical protein A8C56_14700 [Niabella ginsenosidivorans]
MKKAILILLVLSPVLFGCSKDHNEDPANEAASLTATVGGAKKDFGVGAKAHQNNEKAISIVGSTAALQKGKQSESLQLAIFESAEKIHTGTYKMDVSLCKILVTYSIVKPDGTQLNFSASSDSYTPYDAFTITITSINDKEVKGTFSGKVVGGGTTQTISITNGVFSTSLK